VVGDPLEAIASGPTAPDPSTCTDALAILRKYKLDDTIPTSIKQALVETLKPNDPIFSRVENVFVASNEIAVRAALTQAEREGFGGELLTTRQQGEARQVGVELASQLRDSQRPRPFCLLAGGETTVTLCKNHGKGGRNQELALAAIPCLVGIKNVMLITLATDGEDGPTNSAGAVVTGESAQRAESLGLDAADSLKRNDAYPFFAALNDLLLIGPTGTNVNDITLLFAL
jgi:hydroxypyruvate reductase